MKATGDAEKIMSIKNSKEELEMNMITPMGEMKRTAGGQANSG